MTPDTSRLTKDERSLLLYFEDCAVNKAGACSGKHMNEMDFSTAKRWTARQFVSFGRVYSKDLNEDRTNWVRLSKRAWTMVAGLRLERAARTWQGRTWKTTQEK